MSTFEESVKKISDAGKQLSETLSQDKQLEIYSLYKQATKGDCDTAKPGITDPKGQAKWTAWDGKKGMSQDDAKAAYIEIATEVLE